MLTNTTLATRSQEFSALIQSGSFTQQSGTLLHTDAGVSSLLELLRSARISRANVYIIGNGGSAAIASHVATDFCNVGGLNAQTLHEPSFVTCFANDIGYQDVFSTRLKKVVRAEDLLIAISSSGNSLNIINAVSTVKDLGGNVVTLSGFSSANPLRSMGDINYWINSDEYGLVEVAHLFMLHHISDLLGME